MGDETRGGGRSELPTQRSEKRYYRAESTLVATCWSRAIRRSACIRVFMTVRANEAQRVGERRKGAAAKPSSSTPGGQWW